MRKYFNFLLLTILTFTLLSISVFAEVTARGNCGKDLNWSLDSNGTMTVSGAGKMYDWFESSDSPWYKYRQNIKKVVINSGVVSVGDNAFAGCKNLKTVTVPNTVTRLGEWAFENCDALESFTMPDSVTTVGLNLFLSCDALASVTLSKNLKVLDEGIFCWCTSLTSIELPESITVIGLAAFQASGLTKIDSPKNLKSIGSFAFDSCESLGANIVIPQSVQTIEEGVFDLCPSVTSITLLNKDVVIWEYAFGYNWNTSSYSKDIVIKGYEGSTAETYAKENGMTFVAISSKGDANGDGDVDLKDVTTIRRHLAGGYNVVVNEALLDLNSDGTVDLKDVTFLGRYLAGGYGIQM